MALNELLSRDASNAYRVTMFDIGYKYIIRISDTHKIMLLQIYCYQDLLLYSKLGAALAMIRGYLPVN